VVHNTATGTVGIQAGHATGSSVVITTSGPSTPVDVAGELAALRQMLLKARDAGQVDEPTHRAAQAELDTATEALGSTSNESRSRFVLALKRLRGMLDDVADIATTITGLISAVSGPQ